MSSSSMHLSNLVSHQTILKQQKWAISNSIKMGKRRGWGMSGTRAPLHPQVNKQKMLLRALRNAVEVPLDCEPVHYAKDAGALLMKSNWTRAEGDKQVVLRCNTLLPGSGTPAAAFVWTGTSVDWIDFATLRLDAALDSGRVFIYPSAIAFPTGDAFSILPAVFGEIEQASYWSFSNVGRYKGNPFIIGRGGFGTFVDSRYRHILVARPQAFNAKSESWIWSARSTNIEGDNLVFYADAPFDLYTPRVVKFLLAKGPQSADRVGLVCQKRDDRNDPLAIRQASQIDAGGKVSAFKKEVQTPFSNQSLFRFHVVNGKLHFVADANCRSSDGKPAFYALTHAENDGSQIFRIAGSHNGKDFIFGLPANATLRTGVPIFFAKSNALINEVASLAFPLPL